MRNGHISFGMFILFFSGTLASSGLHEIESSLWGLIPLVVGVLGYFLGAGRISTGVKEENQKIHDNMVKQLNEKLRK